MKSYTVKYYFWQSEEYNPLFPEDCLTPKKSRKIKSFSDLVSAMMWISENAENDGDNFIGARIDQKVGSDVNSNE